MHKKKGVEPGLRERMDAQILHAKHRGHITEREIYSLCKAFFKEYLQLEYEFTHEELIEELQKTYLEKQDLEQASAFIRKVGRVEYTSAHYEQKELSLMLDELNTIVHRLAKETTQQKTFLEKLKQHVFHRKKTTAKNLAHEEPENQKAAVLRTLLQQILAAETKEEKHNLYHQAIITYELLEEETKVSFYNDLLSVYYQLQEKEEPPEPDKEVEEKIEQETMQTQTTKTTSKTLPSTEKTNK